MWLAELTKRTCLRFQSLCTSCNCLLPSQRHTEKDISQSKVCCTEGLPVMVSFERLI